MPIHTNKSLALLGGSPVRTQPWPKWPRANQGTEKLLLDVLHSGRWAISGMYNGEDLYEKRFAAAFAQFHGVSYCVPVVNGSAAITMALEALGVGFGDEVLVPGITWVACASAVLRVGGVPVLVDVDENTLCMSAHAARAALTQNTKAILLVHLYCSFADLDAFSALSKETDIPIIEDCSQAHGAIWDGRRVGSYGKIAVFSMQDTKVLTSGEGGAAITNDQGLYEVMQQLRADGRIYRRTPINNQNELEEIGSVQGRNMCLSEFQSAILFDRLQYLDQENSIRRKNADHLNSRLKEIGGVQQIAVPQKGEAVTYYQYCGKVDLGQFGDIDIHTLCNAMTCELGIVFEPIDNPLNNNILYNPLLAKRVVPDQFIRSKINPKIYSLPNAVNASRLHFTFPHKGLLGDEADVECIVQAFEKIKANKVLLNEFKKSKQ